MAANEFRNHFGYYIERAAAAPRSSSAAAGAPIARMMPSRRDSSSPHDLTQADKRLVKWGTFRPDK